MKPFTPTFYKKLMATPAAVYAMERVPAIHLLFLTYLTGLLESEFDINAKSPRGAKGTFQFMPATIVLFERAYGPNSKRRLVPAWSDDDDFIQGQYALLHLRESYEASLRTTPQMALPSSKWPGVELIQKTRFFYHNGPSPIPRYPNESAQDQARLVKELDRIFSKSLSA